MRVIRILIVDDHPLVRAGVRAMLNPMPLSYEAGLLKT
jgi:DNA-binding NarL/FixJ family response regulator